MLGAGSRHALLAGSRSDSVRAPWLLEHRVKGVAVLPASAMVEMALAAGAIVFGSGSASVADVRLDAPPEDQSGQSRRRCSS